MAETYSARPFISHDGPDDNKIRAEVKVVTGFGNIASVDPSDAGKSGKVSFSVENTKFKPAGWAPFDSNVMKIVEEAQQNGEPIFFRLETRRKDSVDREIPINELSKDASTAKDNIHKSLAAVKRSDDDDWTISPFAVTNMAEDPKTGRAPSANDFSIEELRGMKSGGSNGGGGGGGYSSQSEPPPYVTFDRDGNLNPGSIAVSVLLNLYSFVSEYMRDHDLLDTVDEVSKFNVTKKLLTISNEAQIAIYGGDEASLDLSAGSHTRARALVFEAIKTFYPLDAETMTNKEALDDWADKMIDKIVAMWSWSMKEVTKLYAEKE